MQLKEANSAVSNDFDIVGLRTFIERAEDEVVLLIGEAAADEVLANTAALGVIRRCLADLALDGYASSGAILISNSGIQVATGSNRAPASDKKLLAFRRDARERGWQAFEQLILVMERQPTGFDGWKASGERKAYFSTLFSGSGEFGPFGGVAISSTLWMRMRRQIEFVQDDYLVDILGRVLLDGLIALNVVPTLDAKKKQLQRLCMRAVAPLAVADAIRYNMVVLGENGVYQSSVASSTTGDNIEIMGTASGSAINRTLLRLSTEGEAMLVKVRKFLKDHAADFAGVTVGSIYPVQDMNDDPDRSVYLM